MRSQTFLARDGRTVGRIEAQIYKRRRSPTAPRRPSSDRSDAIDDEDVVAALLKAAESWLAGQGASVMHGPLFARIDQRGMRHAGRGLSRPRRWSSCRGTRPISAVTSRRSGCRRRATSSPIVTISTRRTRSFEPVLLNRPEWKSRLRYRPLDLKNLDPKVDLMTELFNDAWRQLGLCADHARRIQVDGRQPEVHQATPDTASSPELDGEAVAFGIIVPNLHDIVADLNGRLGLTGLAEADRPHPP